LAIESFDAFAQASSEHKLLIVETFRRLGYKCGVTGDRASDAPAMKQADLGIAVAGATEAVIAAADISLNEEGLRTISRSIETARKILQRVKIYLTYRIAANLRLLVFLVIALFKLQPSSFRVLDRGDSVHVDSSDWPDHFEMPLVHLLLIAVIDHGMILTLAYDNVIPSRCPETFNFRAHCCVAIVLGGVACASSLLLLWLLLDSWNPHGLLYQLGMGDIDYDTIVCVMYLKISLTDCFTLISMRTRNRPFWSTCPHPFLAMAVCLSFVVNFTIAYYWPCRTPADTIAFCGITTLRDPPTLVLALVLYLVVFLFIQDAFKVATYLLLQWLNIIHINGTTPPQPQFALK